MAKNGLIIRPFRGSRAAAAAPGAGRQVPPGSRQGRPVAWAGGAPGERAAAAQSVGRQAPLWSCGQDVAQSGRAVGRPGRGRGLAPPARATGPARAGRIASPARARQAPRALGGWPRPRRAAPPARGADKRGPSPGPRALGGRPRPAAAVASPAARQPRPAGRQAWPGNGRQVPPRRGRCCPVPVAAPPWPGVDAVASPPRAFLEFRTSEKSIPGPCSAISR
ncbi:translation initiation factor IF-2-like [Jatropha curcas]|uniref:translation initiation factor IF-2-like n=1 Tax=Jatropha curcas TaxID=180498 RepID=UPI001894C0C6|nr:translation initiation factor IF-2-like [Jatropha curcas]